MFVFTIYLCILGAIVLTAKDQLQPFCKSLGFGAEVQGRGANGSHRSPPPGSGCLSPLPGPCADGRAGAFA